MIFSFSEDGDALKITTTGKGHGLGLSLWTANEMAKEGKSYGEILSFFFEGTSLKDDVAGNGSDLIGFGRIRHHFSGKDIVRGDDYE